MHLQAARRAPRLGGFASVLLGVMAAASAGAGTLQGTVTNTLTTGGVDGVKVTIDPGGFVRTTAMGGTYALPLAGGDYTATFTDARFQTHSEPVTVPDVGAVPLDVALTPVAPVIVSIVVTGTATPGASLTATANIDILDGSTLSSVAWTQTAGATVTIGSPTMAVTGVTLPSESTYKDQLVQVLEEPPIGPDQLPPNVTIPPGGFSGGLQNRFQVTAVNPFALEEAGKVTLKADVTTSSGAYSATSDVAAALPWKTAGGLRNVPLGEPVLLHAKSPPPSGSSVYDWALARPAASMASLVDATTQDPWFIPDVTGTYTLTVTDPTSNPSATVTIEIYTGPWHGAITGIGGDGLPLADDCTYCHNDMIAPDKFTPWRKTGHAAIFTGELNTDAHYSSACFSCHSVGYDPQVANNGFDDAFDFAKFLSSGLLDKPAPDNWSNVVHDFPETARLANVQCENCHGPQEGSHGRGAPSISLAADNCGTCHGEPVRHGRFQQWQISGHANYALAIARAGSGDCSRCHTANGFLTWLPVLLGETPGDPLASVTVTWTPDEAQPQTCVTCHDPHSTGTTSGIPTDATVRISGDTPPLIAGFTATNVGRGAICMTCHNSRNGLKNDATYNPTSSASSQAPHPGPQADVLMGQNAYLVAVGVRGPHSTLPDSCVTCHMEKTPPPALLSYNQTGTNHTFAPSPTLCGNAGCHTDGRTAADIQGPVAAQLAVLQNDLKAALLAQMNVLWSQGRSIQVGNATLTGPGDLTNLIFGEVSGRQAITVELKGGGSVGPIAVNSVRVLDGTTDLGDLYQFVPSTIPQAGWNFLVASDDASLGIHNPMYVSHVLSASHTALVPEPGSLASVAAACAALAVLCRRARGGCRPGA